MISSDKNTLNGLKILLIHQPAFDRPTSAIAADSIESLLLSSPLNVDQCGDVYRGLARLGQSNSKTYDIAIICVDGLTSLELEFFSIVARRYPHISIYVYSPHSSRVRLDRAIELGAAGLASAELIRSIVDTQTATPHPQNIQNENAQTPQQLIAGETPHEHTEETSVEISRPQDIAIPEKLIVKDDVLEDEEPLDETQEEPTGPARVPWNRYRDTPARQAPQQQPDRQPSATQEKINDRPQPILRRNIDEPLLTEEELEALLGDDISAIVPNERDALVSDDSAREENVT